jgi:hypothetical protein
VVSAIARGRAARGEPADRLDAVAARHPQVHQHDVGVVLGGERDRLLAVGGGADELDPVEQPEQRAEALADDALVVGEQDADHAGSHSSTGSRRRWDRRQAPPSSSARSAHAGQPVARAADRHGRAVRDPTPAVVVS